MQFKAQMKNDRGSPALIIIYRSLLIFFICLALVFLGGTFYSLLNRHGEKIPVPLPPGEGIFTGIGRLRCLAAGENSVVILSVTFPYDPEDRAFTEELAARVKDFRTVTGEYILSLTADELKKSGEDRLKSALLERFNRILRLGKIEILYFSDFMIIE